MSRSKPYAVLFVLLLALFFTIWPATGKERPGSTTNAAPAPPLVTDGILVPPPPFSEGIFPCSQCHADLPANPTPRKLEEHTNIVLHHDEENRWCLDCHDARNRNKLRLISGKQIDFSESYKLCGQCHWPQLRDWKIGLHGKRTGNWNGQKTYMLCASCHNPHSPHFKPIEPMPEPLHPKE